VPQPDEPLTARAAAGKRLAATGVYAILGGPSADRVVQLARALRRGGVRVFQLRLKGVPDREILATAARLRRVLRGCTLVINDRCDLARVAGADGVHLGQDDLPPAGARRLLGGGAWVGISAGSPREVAAAAAARPDYIRNFPAFTTRTKRDAGRALGLRGFRRLAALTGGRFPLLAVGGIRPDNVGDLIGNGATAVAVASWLTSTKDPERAARQLVEVARAAKRR